AALQLSPLLRPLDGGAGGRDRRRGGPTPADLRLAALLPRAAGTLRALPLRGARPLPPGDAAGPGLFLLPVPLRARTAPPRPARGRHRGVRAAGPAARRFAPVYRGVRPARSAGGRRA